MYSEGNTLWRGTNRLPLWHHPRYIVSYARLFRNIFCHFLLWYSLLSVWLYGNDSDNQPKESPGVVSSGAFFLCTTWMCTLTGVLFFQKFFHQPQESCNFRHNHRLKAWWTYSCLHLYFRSHIMLHCLAPA